MTNKLEISRELAMDLMIATDSMGLALADELRALLAAPVVERQPVAWMYLERSEDGYEYRPLFSPTKWKVLPDGFYEETALYAEQPAPVAVVLPDRKQYPGIGTYPDSDEYAAACAEASTWNACLDKVKELNQ